MTERARQPAVTRSSLAEAREKGGAQERTGTTPQAARGRPIGQSANGHGRNRQNSAMRTVQTAHGGPPDTRTPTGSTERRNCAMRTMHSANHGGSPGARPPTGQLCGTPHGEGNDAHTHPTGQADPT